MTARGLGGVAALDGRVVVVTGASAGIGAAAAQALAAAGARVAVVGRTPAKTEAVAARCGGTPFVCDFARLDSVRDLAAELVADYGRVDVLANNAGLYARRRELTVDGHELTFQVNHLAPFLLTNLLADHLADDARVITTSSRAHLAGRVDRADLESSGRYVAFCTYATTKLENLLFSSELARRLDARGVSAAAFHPGSVRSDFARRGGAVALVHRTPLGRVVLHSPESGADTLCWLATAPRDSSWRSGGYYARRRPARALEVVGDRGLAGWLWSRSAELVGCG